MINKKEKIYLDQEGYEQYVQEIEELKEKLNNNNKAKTSAYETAVGDGWHDNFEFEEAKREEFRIMGLLREKIQGLSRIVIVEKNLNEDIIDINDYVTVNIESNGKANQELLFKLVGINSPNPDSNVREISINSPLGKSVYKKTIGDKGNYEINGNTVSFVIVNSTKSYDNGQNNLGKIKRGK